MTMTCEFEVVEGLLCEFEFTFSGDGSLDNASITHIQLPDGTWHQLPAPVHVYTNELRDFAEAENAEREADWRAEDKLDAIESAKEIDW